MIETNSRFIMTLIESKLEERFERVRNTTDDIQGLAYFCLHYIDHHKRIVQIWFKCLQKSKPAHRLVLIYLANDIVQNAKRKNIPHFTADFKDIMKPAIPYLKDVKIKSSVERVFSIWQDRNMYDSRYISELKTLLNRNSKSNTAVEPKPNLSTSGTTTALTHTSQPPPPPPVIENKTNIHQSSILDCLTRLSKLENDQTIDNTERLKIEIDIRNKLSTLLVECLNLQKEILKKSEDELIQYECKLTQLTLSKDKTQYNK